jgi:uncharacterized protein (DUF362 family)
MLQVYIKKIKTKKISKEIKELLSDIQYIPKKQKIFIKPNISGFYALDSPCIVNPIVVGGIIEYLKDLGCREIVIGELPVPKDVTAVFKISGYKSLCERYDIKLLDLEKIDRRAIMLNDFEITLPSLLLGGQYDYINIAKLKTHIQTVVSLCSKNQKGLLDFSGRKLMHIKGDLHENIKLLTKNIKPDFCIIEGLNALEGDGPGRSGRELKNLNILIFSNSIEAIDWIGSRVMGIEPKTIKHLSEPKEDIEVLGESVEIVRKKFLLSGDHFRQYNIHFWITDKTCSGCSEAMAELKRNLFNSPLLLIKFLYYAFLGRLDILTGDVEIPNSYGKIICLGNCMKDKARVHNLPIIYGCPPNIKNLSNVL